jgi:hypothetical protein
LEIRILPSPQSTSAQRSANISDERSAVAAQVSTSVEWRGEGREFRIASVCAGVMMMAR